MKAYWKRFVGLVTGLRTNYQSDPFRRTEYAIVGLQILFAVILLVVVWTSLNFVHQDVTSTVVAGLIDQKNHGTFNVASTTELIRSVQEVQSQSLLAVIVTIILTTALFGYAIARFALIPNRNALNAQKQFVGNIAHELRTPLSIIKTNTEVALFDEHMDPGMQTMLKSNVEELDRISSIINNLLSISIFVRPEQIEFMNVDMGTVIDAAVKHMSALAKKKNHVVEVHQALYRTVWGNAIALEQVVTNLLKNAINYTPAAGKISITVGPDFRGHILVVIKDSGVGIPRKDLSRIFEPFYRAEASRNRATGSAGLGLTIVSEIIKLHKGKIMISSIEGKGTTVTILLPAGTDVEHVPLSYTHDEEGMPHDGVALDFGSRK
jgi:signal transduction histidine kinase